MTSLVEDKRSGVRRKAGVRAEVVEAVIDNLHISGPHVFGGIDSEPGHANVDESVEIRDDFTANFFAAELQVQQAHQPTVSHLQS